MFFKSIFILFIITSQANEQYTRISCDNSRVSFSNDEEAQAKFQKLLTAASACCADPRNEYEMTLLLDALQARHPTLEHALSLNVNQEEQRCKTSLLHQSFGCGSLSLINIGFCTVINVLYPDSPIILTADGLLAALQITQCGIIGTCIYSSYKRHDIIKKIRARYGLP